MICFEWLQRPENVLAGYLRWTDYSSKDWPNAIRIEHHKAGELVWHPLEETVGDVTTKFYEDAEAILAKLPRRGVPMILREVIPPRGSLDQKLICTLFSLQWLPEDRADHARRDWTAVDVYIRCMPPWWYDGA